MAHITAAAHSQLSGPDIFNLSNARKRVNIHAELYELGQIRLIIITYIIWPMQGSTRHKIMDFIIVDQLTVTDSLIDYSEIVNRSNAE